ncbi:sacsin N-terminal ATP-binding-like domain-containing protein [Winogradskyella sp.]|uniref:sacsin N-terminal ATP-binding-like domain-containing protein n=1 Tax=Winogradskyella sp. TaxID=1883156 RepID=UPI003AB352B8
MDKVIDIQAGIHDLIKKNRDTYRINSNRIISDFRGEKQTTNDYRGRQLLELLQNADDAKTDKIGIHLNTENQTLSVANNGDKFDLNGIQSLLIANLSSKNKKEFIGNKGLGFRSILNWTSEINIKTKAFVLTFSPNIAKQRFEEFIPDPNERNKVIQQNNKYLSKNEVPFAILALPEHKSGISNQDWETVIELKYHKKYEDEIIEQLEAISPRILLFLNHTNEIEILGTDDLDTNIERHFLNAEKTEIQINDNQWHVYNSGELLYPDSDDKFYQFKIAWQDDLSDKDSMFFTYFPTEVSTQLPLLIHATFELNQSRNDLLKGDENQFLLNEIAKAIGEIAVSKIRNVDKSDWKAFQFLQFKGNRFNINSKLVGFYDRLLELKNELEIYPCVDGLYCKLEDTIFYGDEFSKWVIRNNLQEYFSNLLLPIENVGIKLNTSKVYTDEGWLEITQEVTPKISSLKERAHLIKLLLGSSFRRIHESKIKLPLLLDNKNNIIPESVQAFILSKTDIEQYIIPEYVDISFMSGDLYEELLSELEDEVSDKRIGQEHKSRPLKRVVSDVVNIGSNDITDVIRNIVTTSEREMKKSEGEARNDIAMGLVNSLFSIYQVNPDRRNSINLNIQLLNKNLDLCNASDLYLGEDYELGKPTSIIFKDIFDDDDFVAGNEFWQLEEGGYEYLENFFGWLGVNRLTKTNTNPKYLHRDQEDGYTNFVFNNIGWPENNSHKDYTVLQISDFKNISSHKNFSLEVLIAWLITDSKLYNQLSFDNADTFSYKYNTRVTPVNYKPSFVYYQIKELYLKKLDSKFIIELDFAKELGYNSIDFEHPVFKALDIDVNQIASVLNALDLTLSFDDLEPEEVYKIIHEFPQKDSDGKYARKLYNLVFNYFKIKKDLDFTVYTKDYKLFAKRRNQKEYIGVVEVYYSDNSTLPSKIAEEFWMIDLPKRLGESQISKYFGVKTFKDVKIKIETDSIQISNVSSDFQTWFTKIKPYILTYRLRSINKSIEKQEADELKKVEISIVSSLFYSITAEEKKHLLPGEFLPKAKGTGYYLCVKENSTLESLKDTPKVCEAFAEILCMLFKVNDHKDDYRTVFKDRNSLMDTKYLIDVKSLNELHKTALDLLGISNEEINFWAKIYNFKGLVLNNTIKDTKELSESVLKDLGFDMSRKYMNVDYQNLDTEESVAFLRAINNQLEVSIGQIFDANSEGLVNYHLRNFETTVWDCKKFFNSCLWEELNKNCDKQKQLIDSQEKYEDFIRSQEINDMLYESRFHLDVNYIQVLKDEVSKKFGFKLKEEETNKIAIQSVYLKLLKENNFSEVEIEDAEIRSLLYFNGNEDKLKALLEFEKQEEEDSDLDETPSEKLTGKIIFSNSTKVVPKKSGNSNGKRGSWNHSYKDVQRNKKSGKKAEELVYNSLMESDDVTDVEWVSSFSNTSDKSDNKHYDIRYKPINSTNWKYLEVKSFNGSYFHLSKSEKEEAIKRGNDFEIALVIGEKIHILKNYFTEEIDFENNDKFYATPADYIITLKIKSN